MDLKKITEKIEKVRDQYTRKFNIKPDGDWHILKLQEELGELIQVYLMMTKRARQKGKSKKEIKEDFQKEVVDVLGMILLLAQYHKIDINKQLEEKWFKWLKKG